MQQLSKQHRLIVRDFLEYRKFAETMIEERKFLHSQWQLYEKALALKTPVMEAEYAIENRTSLSLYDCLIPAIREHRRL